MYAVLNLLISLVVAQSLLPQVEALVPCFLCGVPDSLPSEKDCMLDETGTTCFDVYKSILISQDRQTCDEDRAKYQDICCGDGNPSLCYTGPTIPPVYNGETGDEPTCRLCGTDVSMIVPTCAASKPFLCFSNFHAFHFRRNTQVCPTLPSLPGTLEPLAVPTITSAASTVSFLPICVDHCKSMLKSTAAAVDTIPIAFWIHPNALQKRAQ